MKKILKKVKAFFVNYLFSFSFWGAFFKVLSRKEKIIFLIFLILTIFSAGFFFVSLYYQTTIVVPREKGKYIEGVVGQIKYLNPIIMENDIDRDLSEIIFSGLLKYSSKGEIIPDLAESYEIKENGTVYEVTLKKNIFWDDGEKITADDVIFTIENIQEPSLNSAEMANWLGVKVEKISEEKIKFILPNPYFPFLERLTVKIVPQHIFEKINLESWRSLSLKDFLPVGSGPFKIENVFFDKNGNLVSIVLKRNELYHEKKPYLENIEFKFFKNEEELLKAFKNKEINGFILSDLKKQRDFNEKNVVNYHLIFPRYFALFFNLESSSEILKEKGFRQALNYFLDKNLILKQILEEKGQIVNSPILPEIYGFSPPSKTYPFDPQKGLEILSENGFETREGKIVKVKKEKIAEITTNLKYGDKGKEVKNLQKCLSLIEDVYPEKEITGYFGEKTQQAVINFQEKYKEEILVPSGLEKGNGVVREKTREILNKLCQKEEIIPVKLTISTLEQPFLIETAQLIKEEWQKVGIETEIQAFPFNTLQREIIKPRNYEILLFGEALTLIPDPFTFWHSSRKKDPGLNLSLFDNQETDEFLLKARQAQSFEELKENLEKFQEIIIEESPAIFLFRPDFVYFLSEKVRGFEQEKIQVPSHRLTNIADWYLYTKRTWK